MLLKLKCFLVDVDGTMADAGVTLLSQTGNVALELKPSTRTTDRVSHWPTPLGFARVASPDAKALLSFGVHEMNMEFILNSR